VQFATAAAEVQTHAGTMTPMSTKLVLTTVWGATVLMMGLAWHATAVSTWLTLLAIAVPPPAILFYFWREPLPSTSERIQESLR
jgi:hypothetical protein